MEHQLGVMCFQFLLHSIQFQFEDLFAVSFFLPLSRRKRSTLEFHIANFPLLVISIFSDSFSHPTHPLTSAKQLGRQKHTVASE